MTTHPQPQPPPTASSPISERTVIGAMATAVTVAAAIAVAVLLTQPAPIMIELAPDSIAADGDYFTHSDADRNAPPGMFPHLDRSDEATI